MGSDSPISPTRSRLIARYSDVSGTVHPRHPATARERMKRVPLSRRHTIVAVSLDAWHHIPRRPRTLWSIPPYRPIAMTDDTQLLGNVSEVEESTVRRIVGVLVALVGLLFVLGLASLVPGMDRLIDGIIISPVAFVIGVVTVLTVGALLWIAPTVETAVEQFLEGPSDAVRNAAVSAKILVVFFAVVIAYRGLAGAVLPMFDSFDITGFYHLGFLAVGLLVLGAFVRRLYRCWKPVTDFLTAYVTTASGSETATGPHVDE